MTTYKRIKEKTARQAATMASMYDMPIDLMEKLITYAKSLCRPGTRDIDQLIFEAQMAQQFNLTSQFIVQIMYDASKAPKEKYMTVDEFCAVLCTFITTDLNRKIKYVFRVYDVNKDGTLSIHEMYTLLKPCVGVGEDKEEAEESVKDLIELILRMTDSNNDDRIDINEFSHLVKENSLYLELFGPCLPPDRETRKFVERLNSKTVTEVKAMFLYERYQSLGDLNPKPVGQLYPVDLDLP